MDEAKEDKVVEKKEAQEPAPVKRQMPSWVPWAGGGALVLLLLLGSYVAGKLSGFERSIMGNRNDGFGVMMRGYGDVDTSPRGALRGDFRGRGMMGTVGTVTAISSDSITVKGTRHGGLVTYKIDANTKVISGTDIKAVSDIKTDATVYVQASTADSTIAANIAIQR